MQIPLQNQLSALLSPSGTLDASRVLLTHMMRLLSLCRHCCPGKWMMAILPLIILVSRKDGLFKMKENTFCRKEHSGTENLRLFLRHKICGSQIPFQYAFYHTHCVRKYKQTTKTHVWWVEKRLHGDSSLVYCETKTFKILSKVPVLNDASTYYSCGLVFLWDGSQSQWSFTLESAHIQKEETEL